MKDFVKQQLELMLPRQEHFERVFGRSQWACHLKNTLKNSSMCWILTERRLVGEEATIKIALTKIRCAEDMKKLIKKLST